VHLRIVIDRNQIISIVGLSVIYEEINPAFA